MNVLVTGANGQLGTEMRNVFAGSAHHVVFTDINDIPEVRTEHLDITDPRAVEAAIGENGIEIIINCAAYTNVDRAEDDAAAAQLLNASAPATLAAAASAAGATIIHISTDYVFGGDASIPYRETDRPSPLGIYGRTKYEGEKAIEASGCKCLIFRTSWLYSPYGSNFVKTMRRLLAEKDSLDVVSDQVGTPTYAADLAALIYKIIDEGLHDRTGVYHFSDEGVCSWYDFAFAVRELSGTVGMDGRVCEIRPCSSGEYPSKARRPHYSVLDKTKVKETFGVSIPHWTESLKTCIARMQTNI